MPPIRPVPTLLDTSLKCFGKFIITLWKRKHKLQDLQPVFIDGLAKSNSWVQILRKYFKENLIIPMRNCLLSHIIYQVLHTKYDGGVLNILENGEEVHSVYIKLQDSLCQHDIRKILSDVLLILGGETFTSIDLSRDHFASNYIEDSIGIHCREALMHSVLQNHLWAGNLQSLSLKYLSHITYRVNYPISLCDIIKIVAENCHNLEYLDVESLKEPTCDWDDFADSLRWLYGDYVGDTTPKGCPKLKTLILPKFKASLPAVVDHVVKMLCFMPGLCVLRNIDTRTVVEKYMKEMAVPKPLNLVELEEWKKKYKKGIVHLINVLPNLRTYKFYLGGSMKSEFLKLETLSSHFSLETLELHFDSWSSFELDIDFMGIPRMSNLDCLTIDVDQEGLNLRQVENLSWAFPNVSRLRLQGSGLFDYQYLNRNERVNHDTLFQNLKSLELNVMEIDVKFLTSFLDRCPNLTSIYLSIASIVEESLSDEQMPIRDIISEIGERMRNLEKIMIANEDPDSMPLDLFKEDALNLMMYCPRLTWLGRLSAWCVTEEEVEELFKISKSNNWDIHLSFSQIDLIDRHKDMSQTE